MRFRKLRITWSVFCGLACVLLIALWVRSYQWTDNVLGEAGSEFSQFIIQNGELTVEMPSALRSILKFKWEHERMDAGGFLGRNPSWLPRYYNKPEELIIPFWTIEAFACGLALLPWLPCRFSLRTLLIATTLVAVVLGLIVAVLRWPAG